MRAQLGCARDSAMCEARMHARQSFLPLCRDRDLRIATLFLGMLGGFGHESGLLCRDRDLSALCHDRDLSALCRDRNLVSLQSLGLG